MDLLSYVLDYLNDGRGPPDIPFTESDFAEIRLTNERVSGDGSQLPEVRVRILQSGSIFYLPAPPGYVPEGVATVVETAADPGLEDLITGSDPGAVQVPSDLGSLTVPKLQDLCGHLGLARSGTKKTLITRIEEHVAG